MPLAGNKRPRSEIEGEDGPADFPSTDAPPPRDAAAPGGSSLDYTRLETALGLPPQTLSYAPGSKPASQQAPAPAPAGSKTRPSKVVNAPSEAPASASSQPGVSNGNPRKLRLLVPGKQEELASLLTYGAGIFGGSWFPPLPAQGTTPVDADVACSQPSAFASLPPPSSSSDAPHSARGSATPIVPDRALLPRLHSALFLASSNAVVASRTTQPAPTVAFVEPAVPAPALAEPTSEPSAAVPDSEADSEADAADGTNGDPLAFGLPSVTSSRKGGAKFAGHGSRALNSLGITPAAIISGAALGAGDALAAADAAFAIASAGGSSGASDASGMSLSVVDTALAVAAASDMAAGAFAPVDAEYDAHEAAALADANATANDAEPSLAVVEEDSDDEDSDDDDSGSASDDGDSDSDGGDEAGSKSGEPANKRRRTSFMNKSAKKAVVRRKIAETKAAKKAERDAALASTAAARMAAAAAVAALTASTQAATEVAAAPQPESASDASSAPSAQPLPQSSPTDSALSLAVAVGSAATKVKGEAAALLASGPLMSKPAVGRLIPTDEELEVLRAQLAEAQSENVGSEPSDVERWRRFGLSKEAMEDLTRDARARSEADEEVVTELTRLDALLAPLAECSVPPGVDGGAAHAVGGTSLTALRAARARRRCPANPMASRLWHELTPADRARLVHALITARVTSEGDDLCEEMANVAERALQSDDDDGSADDSDSDSGGARGNGAGGWKAAETLRLTRLGGDGAGSTFYSLPQTGSTFAGDVRVYRETRYVLSSGRAVSTWATVASDAGTVASLIGSLQAVARGGAAAADRVDSATGGPASKPDSALVPSLQALHRAVLNRVETARARAQRAREREAKWAAVAHQPRRFSSRARTTVLPPPGPTSSGDDAPSSSSSSGGDVTERLDRLLAVRLDAFLASSASLPGPVILVRDARGKPRSDKTLAAASAIVYFTDGVPTATPPPSCSSEAGDVSGDVEGGAPSATAAASDGGRAMGFLRAWLRTSHAAWMKEQHAHGGRGIDWAPPVTNAGAKKKADAKRDSTREEARAAEEAENARLLSGFKVRDAFALTPDMLTFVSPRHRGDLLRKASPLPPVPSLRWRRWLNIIAALPEPSRHRMLMEVVALAPPFERWSGLPPSADPLRPHSDLTIDQAIIDFERTVALSWDRIRRKTREKERLVGEKTKALEDAEKRAGKGRTRGAAAVTAEAREAALAASMYPAGGASFGAGDDSEYADLLADARAARALRRDAGVAASPSFGNRPLLNPGKWHEFGEGPECDKPRLRLLSFPGIPDFKGRPYGYGFLAGTKGYEDTASQAGRKPWEDAVRMMYQQAQAQQARLAHATANPYAQQYAHVGAGGGAASTAAAAPRAPPRHSSVSPEEREDDPEEDWNDEDDGDDGEWGSRARGAGKRRGRPARGRPFARPASARSTAGYQQVNHQQQAQVSASAAVAAQQNTQPAMPQPRPIIVHSGHVYRLAQTPEGLKYVLATQEEQAMFVASVRQQQHAATAAAQAAQEPASSA